MFTLVRSPLRLLRNHLSDSLTSCCSLALPTSCWSSVFCYAKSSFTASRGSIFKKQSPPITHHQPHRGFSLACSPLCCSQLFSSFFPFLPTPFTLIPLFSHLSVFRFPFSVFSFQLPKVCSFFLTTIICKIFKIINEIKF